jgi:mRNA interferase RelE/StbE
MCFLKKCCMRLNISVEASKRMLEFPPKHQAQLAKKIQLLLVDPTPPPSKQLVGHAPLRRLTSGDYRIVYYVQGDVLYIVLVDTRTNVYANLGRKF